MAVFYILPTHFPWTFVHKLIFFPRHLCVDSFFFDSFFPPQLCVDSSPPHLYLARVNQDGLFGQGRISRRHSWQRRLCSGGYQKRHTRYEQNGTCVCHLYVSRKHPCMEIQKNHYYHPNWADCLHHTYSRSLAPKERRHARMDRSITVDVLIQTVPNKLLRRAFLLLLTCWQRRN